MCTSRQHVECEHKFILNMLTAKSEPELHVCHSFIKEILDKYISLKVGYAKNVLGHSQN